MKIEIPPEVFGVRKWLCTVRSNDNVATFIKELVLELPEGDEVPFRAGGYIQIECPPTPSTTRTSTSRALPRTTGTSSTCGSSSPRSTSR
jgi:Na+-transporting NADH:ubiquinone oxidoreductase subunit NqrF